MPRNINVQARWIAFFCVVATGLLGATSQGQDEEKGAGSPEERRRECLQYMREHPGPTGGVWMPYVALLEFYTRNDIAKANEVVLKFCREQEEGGHEASLFRIYLMDETRELLTPEARNAIEDNAWNMVVKWQGTPLVKENEASLSYFHRVGSENIRLSRQCGYTLALEVVRSSERYGTDKALGNATVGAQYRAWIDYWVRLLRERAVSGSLDIEVAHPSTYGMVTVGTYYDLYDLVKTAEVRRLAGNFLDLYWAEVATEFEPRTGMRAGWSTTRNSFWAGERGYWATPILYTYGWHDLGSERTTYVGMADFLVSGYRPPEIVTAIARDGERGSYLATSHRAGPIESVWLEGQPRYFVGKPTPDWKPLDDTNLRRDVYYTPDYALSTLTYNPLQAYDPHITLKTTMGAMMSAAALELIVVRGNGGNCERAITGITGEGVSIVARDVNAAAPPGRARFASDGTFVFFGKGTQLWANREEDPSGWFFTRSGNAYAALRVADGGYAITPFQERGGFRLNLNDMWAPIVIQMGRAKDYESFDAFKASVRSNRFEYAESDFEFAPGKQETGILTYVSEAGDTYRYHARSIVLPDINGAPVNLNPKKTFDSPFLSMIHGESVATVRYPGFKDLLLDFDGHPEYEEKR